MADVTEVIKRLIVEAQTRGLDKAAADFEKFSTTAKQASTTTENSLASTGKSFERLAGSIDPARKQLQLLAKDLATLESGRGRAGVSDEYLNGLKEARTAQAAANIEILKTTPAVGQQTAAMGQHAQAAKLSAYEMKNLGFQVNDAVTMLGTGSSAFQVLASQGGQVLQVLQGGGGLTANIKDLGTRLLGLVTPANVAFGAIAAGAAATAYSINKLMADTKEARLATTAGPGRRLGLTPQDVQGAAERARAPGMSLGESREGVVEGLRAGGASLETIEKATELSKRYAETVQMDLLPAQKELQRAFADPVKGAEMLEEKLRLGLTPAMKDQIAQMQANGQTAQAALVLSNQVTQAVASQELATTAAGRGWADFKTGVDQAASGFGMFVVKALEANQMLPQGTAANMAYAGSATQAGEASKTFADAQAQAGAASRAAAADVENMARVQTQVAATVANSAAVFQAQVAVMNATTVEARALAMQQQVLVELGIKNTNTTIAQAQAEQAANQIRAQAAAQSTQKIADQQIELQINDRIISAYQLQGQAVEGLVARLKEEQAIRQAGLDITAKDSQARIENAGRIAEQTKAISEASSARQAESSSSASSGGSGGGGRVISPGFGGGIVIGGGMETDPTDADRRHEAEDRYWEAVKKGQEARNEQRRQAHAEAMREAAEEARANERIAAERRKANAEGEFRMGGSTTGMGPGQIAPRGASFTSDLIIPFVAPSEFDRTFGKGNWTGPGIPDLAKIADAEAAALKQKSDMASQALQSAIGFASRALSKQIQDIQQAASDQLSALSDAAQEAADALSAAADKRQELESKLKEQEDKRQQRIQNYLAAGPSPFEKNADIFYDPKSRMAFAEQIAGNTDELLVAQLAAAKAQEDAAKDADKNAKAAVKAGEATQKAAEEQVKQLQAQQEQLEMQAELLSAGLDINSGISNNVLALIGVIKSELPASIADHMSALMGATAAKSQTQVADINKTIPAVTAGWQNVTGGANQTLAGISAIGGGGTSLGGYGVGGTSLGVRRYARGGEFTVPGSYSAGDRPFVVGLAGQERVTVETPAQQAARSRGGGGSSTNIENLIVQMPPATNPVEYLNKRSRPALGRAVRSMARGAGAR